MIKEQVLRGQKMMIGIAFTFLKIVKKRESKNWESVPRVRSLRKETSRS